MRIIVRKNFSFLNDNILCDLFGTVLVVIMYFNKGVMRP